MIILDTCGLLWLASGSTRLSPAVLESMNSEPVVSVSAVSALEIALKAQSGKLKLPMPAREWWNRAIAHHHLTVLQLDPDTLIRSAELPPIHRDPADRIIIATALAAKAPVVTADARFAGYGVDVVL